MSSIKFYPELAYYFCPSELEKAIDGWVKFPNLDAYHEGSWFDLRNASFCDRAPLHPDYLLLSEASGISLLMRMDYENMHLFRLSHHERNRIADTVLRYYCIHVPDMPELKSFQVMRELFS